MHTHLAFETEKIPRLKSALNRFPSRRIMVVGDLMLDVFVWGEVQRISPEAPVPVVDVHEETRLLGGSANVVHNVAALGAMALVSGVVGSDPGGRELVRLLRQAGVSTDGVVVEDKRPTTMKTRIIARNQQVVRFDREERRPVGGDTLDHISRYLEDCLDRVDAVIFSDYAKGVITPGLMDRARSMGLSSRVPVIVDPKVQHAAMYRGVTLVTPNHHEAARMAGIEIRTEADLKAAADILLRELQCETVLITRGKDGMSLFHRNGDMESIPTVARRVFDVTGAGDTVIATMALGMAAGLSTVDAALLANLAAGIVVGEVGTAAVSRESLAAALEACAC
ncbi:MAG: D-glycero-beta-D-manno-heptose-7-phosphate kinase [Syntrophobacteraceae bacterium]|jgi:D-beta-D-heptose 7-phosphate kinase/D-beta-D-heptose 1-phosphate adenosyltransferase|nr:D-glycero-beta-D-manno-heptose-7-phosphate kinase [Syntrophobacteraceae bacterium]